MNQATVRNLEQIQEQDDATPMPRALSLGLVALGVACVAFAIVAVGGRKTGAVEKRPDPLGDLVAQHARDKSASPDSPTGTATATQLSAKDVTFPSILSDDARPTTALAAVRPQANVPGAAAAANGIATAPPPASDRLPVVTFAGGTPPVPHDDNDAPLSGVATNRNPLPAQNVLEATPIVTRPRDAMTKTASEAGEVNTPSGAQAPSGHDGGWQLQVSSFKTKSEAEQFSEQLRARGHKSYTAEAHVPGRGTWWRVRVGPFPSEQKAKAYRQAFEAREHVVPFVVQPEKSSEGH